MTEHKNDNDSTSEIPSRPEGQDTSETMDDKTQQEPDTTAVLPPATPPTQEIAQATQRIPAGSAPEGEVHPAYGIAAAQAEAEATVATPAVQDAPAHDDDPLAPLRDPEPARDPAPQVPHTPAATTPPSGTGAGTTQPTPPVRPAAPVQQAQPAQQPAQPDAPAGKRRARVGTAVWGLIVIAVGLGILAVSAGVIFDLGAALIVVVGAAGVILVVGSVVSSVRRR